jgi:hypothetical protein
VDEFLDETHDERDAYCLVTTGGDHVELVGAREELLDVKWGLACGGTSGLGADAREESRSCRPDARALAFFGGEHTVQERHRRVMLAVSIGQFVKKIIATSLVDARCELSDGLTAQCACVHEWSDECARSFGPMVITSFASTASCDIKKASRGENCAIPS